MKKNNNNLFIYILLSSSFGFSVVTLLLKSLIFSLNFDYFLTLSVLFYCRISDFTLLVRSREVGRAHTKYSRLSSLQISLTLYPHGIYSTDKFTSTVDFNSEASMSSPVVDSFTAALILLSVVWLVRIGEGSVHEYSGHKFVRKGNAFVLHGGSEGIYSSRPNHSSSPSANGDSFIRSILQISLRH